MVALALAMALSGLFFLSLILFLVLAQWMLAMALSGVFSWALFCVSCPCQLRAVALRIRNLMIKL